MCHVFYFHLQCLVTSQLLWFFFLIECSLTAEMSVKHGVTVPSWKMDLTIQCVLCHVEAIHKLFFFCCKQMKIIWLHSWRYPILFFFFFNSFFPQIWDVDKVVIEMSRMNLAGCLLFYFEECFSLLSRYIGTLYLCTKVGRGAVYSVLLCCINTLSFSLVLHLYKIK